MLRSVAGFQDVRVVKEFGAVLVLCDTILLVLNLFNLEITGRLMAGVQW